MIYYILQFVCLFITLCVWIYSSRPNENILAKTVLGKYLTYLHGIYFMILSKETKGLGIKYLKDPAEYQKYPESATVSKQVVFIRHGESEWNDIFNKGLNPMLFVRLLKGFIRETKLLITHDSVFIDSSLNEDGFKQACELSSFFQNSTGHSDQISDYIAKINGKSGTSKICSSNLRRAIATTTVGLYPRLVERKEKIHILSSLQEISRNIDTQALAEAKELPNLDVIAKHVDNFVASERLDASENNGNKTFYFNGVKRIKAFNDWVFHQEEELIIAGGHSLWFKHYFQTCLPFGFSHDCKSKKIANSGAIGFKLNKTHLDEKGNIGYWIDPESIVTIYGGYTSK